MTQPRMSTDYDEWLAHYNTPEDIQLAVDGVLAWIDYYHQERDPLLQGIKHWEHRLALLRTKALLMGFTLESPT